MTEPRAVMEPMYAWIVSVSVGTISFAVMHEYLLNPFFRQHIINCFSNIGGYVTKTALGSLIVEVQTTSKTFEEDVKSSSFCQQLQTIFRSFKRDARILDIEIKAAGKDILRDLRSKMETIFQESPCTQELVSEADHALYLFFRDLSSLSVERNIVITCLSKVFPSYFSPDQNEVYPDQEIANFIFSPNTSISWRWMFFNNLKCSQISQEMKQDIEEIMNYVEIMEKWLNDADRYNKHEQKKQERRDENDEKSPNDRDPDFDSSDDD